jgi:hypothetical protein
MFTGTRQSKKFRGKIYTETTTNIADTKSPVSLDVLKVNGLNTTN